MDNAELLQGAAQVELEDADLYALNDDETADAIAQAVELVGKRIRDSNGREWVVDEVDAKDGWPTICNGLYWDRAEAVTVL